MLGDTAPCMNLECGWMSLRSRGHVPQRSEPCWGRIKHTLALDKPASLLPDPAARRVFALGSTDHPMVGIRTSMCNGLTQTSREVTPWFRRGKARTMLRIERVPDQALLLAAATTKFTPGEDIPRTHARIQERARTQRGRTCSPASRSCRWAGVCRRSTRGTPPPSSRSRGRGRFGSRAPP
jgi:hypothetical protein